MARYHIVQNNGRLNNINDFSSHTLEHKTNNIDGNLYETTYFKTTSYGSEVIKLYIYIVFKHKKLYFINYFKFKKTNI